MSEGQNIQVFVRCRPIRNEEKCSDVEIVPEQNEVRVPPQARGFNFDRVFSQNASQNDIYTVVVRPLIPQVLAGYNCAVLAYGQTGTGKTYTMEGNRSDDDTSWEDGPNSGIIPRAISQLFDSLRLHDNDHLVKVSFLELYNEDAYDLLSPIDDTTKLKIFDDAQRKGSVIVGGLEEIIVQSKKEIYDILKRGSIKRQTAATLLNACSSRSHTIFSVMVQVKEGVEQEQLKTGKLNLVDLAGSENIGRSGAQDKRAREAGNINQSLLTLGRVITALVEKRPHIPYRESKLTRILQDSLGGSTKTSMIATISPAEEDLGNTIGTIDYASRARCIINKPERQMTQRKMSEIDLQEYKSKLKSELEIQIRNEVALEFRRATDKCKEEFRMAIDKCKEEYNKELAEKNKVLTEKNEQIHDLQTKNVELEQMTQKKMSEIDIQEHESKLKSELEIQIRDEMELEFQRETDKIKEKHNKVLIEKNEQILDLQTKNVELEQINGELQRMNSELQRLNVELQQMNGEPTQVRQASKVRKRAPIQESLDDYANTTFDGDDEIVQLSTKKARKGITACGRKLELHKELTLSGRKKKLRSVDEDIELSPTSPPTPPVRVTRSRATKRKLDY